MSLVSLGDNRKSRHHQYKCDEINHSEREGGKEEGERVRVLKKWGGSGAENGGGKWTETLKGKEKGISQVGRNRIET
jgi:hypothetical protein